MGLLERKVEFFFFSSRRRHTRSDRDWSSDVCSSDLVVRIVDRQTGLPFLCGGLRVGRCAEARRGEPLPGAAEQKLDEAAAEIGLRRGVYLPCRLSRCRLRRRGTIVRLRRDLERIGKGRNDKPAQNERGYADTPHCFVLFDSTHARTPRAGHAFSMRRVQAKTAIVW